MLKTSLSIVTLAILLPGLAAAGSSTTSGSSNAMNPALSVNGLFHADFSRDDKTADGRVVQLQEAEMHFTSIVDPFWKANVILAVFPEDGDRSSFEVGLEEANIDATNLPWGVAMKLGKFFVPFGKHAPLHTHQFPFVAAPVAVESFLGGGLTETGGSLAMNMPLPWWSDLTLYGLNGDTEIFAGDDADPVLGGRWSNLWDSSDDATLELGGSVIHGPGSKDHFGDAGTFSTYGLDLTWKWVDSSRSHGPAATLTAELLMPDLAHNDGDPFGWYAYLQMRRNRDWWFGAAIGGVDRGQGLDDTGAVYADFGGELREYKLNATFTPSEFSALRFETSYVQDPETKEDDLRFSVQWNFTIGSHPAHLY